MTSEEIKEKISMYEILRQYHISANQQGFICCPFHHEKTASMKVFNDSYYCFGCGCSGDIFSFVQQMDGVDFKTAFQSLGGTYHHNETDYQRNLRNYRLKKRKETEKFYAMRRRQEVGHTLINIKILKLCKRLYPPLSEGWCDAVNQLEYQLYKLTCLTDKGGKIRWSYLEN